MRMYTLGCVASYVPCGFEGPAHLHFYHEKPVLEIGKDIPLVVLEYVIEEKIPVVWDWDGYRHIVHPVRLENMVAAYKDARRRSDHIDTFGIIWCPLGEPTEETSAIIQAFTRRL